MLMGSATQATPYLAQDHELLSVCLHALMAIARVHFGPDRTRSRLAMGESSGSHRLTVTGRMFLSTWCPTSVGVAELVAAEDEDRRTARLDVNGCEESLREAIDRARAEGFVARSISWVDVDGVRRGAGAPELAVGPTFFNRVGRRPYRGCSGVEALSWRQERLASTFGGAPRSGTRAVTRSEVDILLSEPYGGGGRAFVDDDAEVAAAMLSEIGIAWETWEADLRRARDAPRSRPVSSTSHDDLIFAVVHEDVPGVKRALMSGAEIDRHVDHKLLRELKGYTASLLALHYQGTELFELLLEHGANPRLKYPWGASLLRSAIAKRRNDAVSMLFARGLDPREDDQATDLFWAALRLESLELMEILLDAGAPLDPAPPRQGVMHVRVQLARMARRRGNEALALRIERTPLG